MPRSLTNTVGGGTNRRLLLLALAAGLVGAVLVYAAVSRGSDSTDSAGSASSMVPVVTARIDIPPRTKITTDMVEVRQVAPDSRSELAYTDVADVVGRISRYPLATSEQILSTKVVSLASAAETGDSLSYVIPEGKRGISIQVNQVTSGGGLVLPGDYVDIIGVFDFEFRDGDDEETEERYFASLILQNVEVLAVAQTVVDTPPEAGTTADGEAIAQVADGDGQRVRNTDADADPGATTVTLSVTLEQAQLLFLAEENAVLRLAVRAYGDSEVQDVPFVVETSLIPPNLPKPFTR